MKKNIFLCLLFFAFASTAFSYNATLARLVKTDYSGKADSLNEVFVNQFMDITKGTFRITPKGTNSDNRYIYWQQAHAIDVVVYAYERHKAAGNTTMTSKYRQYISRWYQNKGNNYSGGSTGFENPYTDDMCWITLTLLHMSEALGQTTYATTARRLFDNGIMSRATEDEKGLWLPWNDSPGSGPNACTLSPACLIAAKLYQRYGDEKYLEYAEKFYTYMTKHIAKSDGRVEEPPLTYTQGTFGEACRLLYHITNKSTYRNMAMTYINYAFTSGRCTENGILRHEGTSMDQSIFKAVLIPYAVNYCLDDKMTLKSRRDIFGYLLKNADALWKNLDKESYPKMFCNYYWGKPYDSSETASMGAMASGASLMENVTRMCIDVTTQETSIEIPYKAPEVSNSVIYRLDGKAVRQGTTNTQGLPAGIYVVNGRKVYVK